MEDQYSTPILLLIFNRPEPALKTFAEIKKVRPSNLFIAADGPRAHKQGEDEKCAETRKAILDQIDWECDVQTLFRDQNLGCKHAVSSAISWFFDQVEQGIILEDDCLPHPSFFPYVETLLNHYHDDERVMMISGDNFQQGNRRGDGSYYFSQIPHIWGWASWRRAWQKYDIEMKTYDLFKRQNVIRNIFDTVSEQQFWMQNFTLVAEQRLDTWDFQWVYAIFCNNSLCIAPNVNLVSNIGFDENATHTTNASDRSANRPTQGIEELNHPSFIIPDRYADKFTAEHVFNLNLEPTNFAQKQNKYIRKFINIIRGHR